MHFWISLILLSLTASGMAQKYDYLKKFESDIRWPVPEHSVVKSTLPTSPRISLKGYYSEFSKDKTVSVYVGGGAEFFQPQTSPQLIFEEIWAINENEDLGLTGLQLEANKRIRFYDPAHGISFKITIGGERNEFINALATNEVVIYMGHARYGRGPAFQNLWNYFRMGYEFPTIELDVRNKYFLDEPLFKTAEFPPQPITLGSQEFEYQYRGHKDPSSYLPTTAYTKVIEGNGKDLFAANFLPSKQIFMFHSCSSEPHWSPSLRELFPDPNLKLFFGTTQEVQGSYRSTAVLITSLAQQLGSSNLVLNELLSTEPRFVSF